MSGRIELPKIVSEEKVRFFVENGYLVLPDLVSPQEIEELKADTVKLARGDYQCEGIQPASPELTDEEVLQNILCIHQPHFVSPVMEKFIRHEKICGVLSQIVAAHLPFWDGSVKCMQSMLFVKGPGMPGNPWHQDEDAIPTRDRSLCGAWIAIDDATIDNGCLWVIPASHRQGYIYGRSEHDNDDEYDYSGQSTGFDESGKIPVEVKAGTVVFFNGYLLHNSLKNRSDTYRMALVNHYMNAYSLLPWGKSDINDQTIGEADVREIIPVAGIDPYQWKGYQNPPQKVFLRNCKVLDKSEERQFFKKT